MVSLLPDRISRLIDRIEAELAVDGPLATFQEISAPVKKKPLDGDALWKCAEWLFRENRFDLAKHAFALARNTAPRKVSAWNGLGFCCHRRQQTRLAVTCFKHAVKLDPAYPASYANLGTVLSELGRDEEALKMFDKAVALDDSRAAIWFNWGNSLRRFASCFADACEKYSRAVALDPDLAIAYHNHALLLWTRGRFVEARYLWSTARAAYERRAKDRGGELKAEDQCFYGYLLHFVYFDYQRALSLYRAAESSPHLSDSRHFILLSNKIGLLLELDEQERTLTSRRNFHLAREAFERLCRLYAKCRTRVGIRERNILAAMHLEFGDHATGESLLTKTLVDEPQNSEAHRLLGLSQLGNGRKESALFHLRYAHELDPEDIHTHCAFAEALLQTGDPERAERRYNMIMRAAPQFIRALVGLGKTCLSMADDGKDPHHYRRAIHHFDTALRLHGTDRASRRMGPMLLADTLYARAYARARLFELERTATRTLLLRDALEDCRRCLSNDPSHQEALKARTTLANRLHKPRENFLFHLGHVLLLSFTTFVMLMTQFDYYWGDLGAQITPTGYLGMTAAEFAIFVVAISLPEILKLKIGVIELEKAKHEVSGDEGPLLLSAPLGDR